MEGFLEFLSNYYLYFLIAAGVLFFALLGFLIDLKRNKKDSTEEVPDLITPTSENVEPNLVNDGVELNQTVQMPENVADFVDNNINTPMNVNANIPNENLNYNQDMSQVVNPEVNQPAPVNYNQNMGGVPNPEVSQPAPVNYNQAAPQVPNQNMNMPQPNLQNVQPQNFSNENIEEFK